MCRYMACFYFSVDNYAMFELFLEEKEKYILKLSCGDIFKSVQTNLFNLQTLSRSKINKEMVLLSVCVLGLL